MYLINDKTKKFAELVRRRCLDKTPSAHYECAERLVETVSGDEKEKKELRRLLDRQLKKRGKENPDFVTFGGELICEACNLGPLEHPKDSRYSDLRVLCNGTKVRVS
jgi:hypothetical protein